MRKPRIILDFLRNSDPRLEIQSNAILSCMSNNQYYPTPTPTLGEVTTAVAQYSAALSAAQNRDRINIEMKNKTRGILELMLKRLSNYVMLVAGDDRAIMSSAGFTISAETVSKSSMGQVKDFSVTVGKVSGEATLSVKPLKGAKFYIYYYALATEPLVWQHKPANILSLPLTGFYRLQPTCSA